MCISKCAQLCLTFCDPMDCRPPGSSVHSIFWAKILKWVAISSSKLSSQSRGRNHVSYVSCIYRQVLYRQCHLGSPHVHISTFFKILFPFRPLQSIVWSSLCYSSIYYLQNFNDTKAFKKLWQQINHSMGESVPILDNCNSILSFYPEIVIGLQKTVKLIQQASYTSHLFPPGSDIIWVQYSVKARKLVHYCSRLQALFSFNHLEKKKKRNTVFICVYIYPRSLIASGNFCHHHHNQDTELLHC